MVSCVVGCVSALCVYMRVRSIISIILLTASEPICQSNHQTDRHSDDQAREERKRVNRLRAERGAAGGGTTVHDSA